MDEGAKLSAGGPFGSGVASSNVRRLTAVTPEMPVIEIWAVVGRPEPPIAVALAG